MIVYFYELINCTNVLRRNTRNLNPVFNIFIEIFALLEITGTQLTSWAGKVTNDFFPICVNIGFISKHRYDNFIKLITDNTVLMCIFF